MPSKRDDFKKLTVQDYDILGNHFRVWRAADGNIEFLLDETLNDDKPNVFLIVNPVEDRKWDDILQNDYGIDLETIRPRKNNKYQKLDIEYDGVDVYSVLINAYDKGQNVTNLMDGLLDYRYAVSRRSAMTRLSNAKETLEQSQDTVVKATNTIAELQQNQRELKTKLSSQKKGIGREPTKESASKILKTESRIDDNNQRLKRAKKRLTKAERRLQNAKDEIAQIEEFLKRPRPTYDGAKTDEVVEIKEKIKTVEAKQKTANNITVIETEKKMADEEVKPLMNQDPEIINDEGAFKPVAFDDIKIIQDEDAKEEKLDVEITETKPEVSVESGEMVSETPVAKPLDFAPVQTEETTKVVETTVETTEEETPVLETITSVEAPSVSNVDTTGNVTVGQYDAAAERPVVAAPVYSRPTRPVSPLGNGGGYGNGGAVNSGSAKNSRLYYLLLIALIVLSVFTLWLFQHKHGETVPELKTTTDVVEEQQIEEPVVDFDTKSEIEEVQEPEVEPEPVVLEPEIEPEPIIEPEPEVEPEPVIEDRPESVVQTHDVILQEDTGGPNVGLAEETYTEAYTNNVNYSTSQETVVMPVPEPVVPPLPEPEAAPATVVQETVVKKVHKEFPAAVSAPVQKVVAPQPMVEVPMPQPQFVKEPAFMVEPQYIPEPRFISAPQYNNVPPRRYDNAKRNVDVHDGGQYTVIYDD